MGIEREGGGGGGGVGIYPPIFVLGYGMSPNISSSNKKSYTFAEISIYFII